VVLPVQERRAREHVHLMIEAHDSDKDAHGRVEHRLNRVLWLAFGCAGAGGVGGVGLQQLLSIIGVM
jgi:hypothetical protein